MVRRALLHLFPVFSTAPVRLGLVVGLCIGVLAALPAGASAAAYGPVAAYSFDEGSGETVEDVTGDGHTATIHGAKWTIHGRYGGGMEFNEHEETYLSVPDSSELDLTEEFTLEAWVRPEEGRTWQPIVDKQVGGEGGPELPAWWLYAAGPEAQRPWGGTEHAAAESDDLAASEPLAPEVWSHVALTFDGAVERLYVDGVLVESCAAKAPLETGGEVEIGGATDVGDFLFGRLDELRIYDRVLGAAEVAADMETPLETPKQGPVAAWSFDQDGGETAGDVTGDGNQGTLEGPTWTKGRYGSALEFDGGAHDCVTVPDSASLQLGEEFTVEAWVKPSVLYHGPIISKAAELTPSYELAIGTTGTGLVQGWAGGYDEYAETEVHSAQKLEPDVWTHLALTYDGAYLRLYVDGHLAGTSTHAEFVLESGGPLTIGCSGVEEQWFSGKIDEVRLYERALGEGELADDMESPLETPRQGPVAEWSFDEGAGTTVADAAGENDGTVEGATWSTGGRYGDALQFDGEEDCVSVPDSASLQLGDEFTLEAWVKPVSPLHADPIIYKESGGGYSYSLGLGYTQDGRLEGWAEDESEEQEHVVSPAPLSSRKWTHVAYTYDGDKMRLYVDGTLVATKEVGTASFASDGPLSIGCSPDTHEFFGGRIDEPRVYERALSGTEIAADMEAPIQTPKATPVAEYSFDEGEEGGEVVQDVTGDGHTATIHGASWTTHGRYGGGMQFDGEEGDYLSVPESAELDFTEEFTLEAWVRPESGYNQWSPLIDKQIPGEDGLSDLTYYLYEGDYENDRPHGGVAEGEYLHAGESLREDSWSHLALTYDGEMVRLYVDGRLVDEGCGEAPPISEGELEIGGSTEQGNFLNGRIDEVRLYNRALNGAEVGTDMEAPIQTPKQGPIAAWSFDEIEEGGTVEDLTGDGHTATIEGAELARGKYGDALQFDGEDDVVKVPNSPEFDLTEAFTLEAWVRPESKWDKWAPILAKEMGGGDAADEIAWWIYEGGNDANVPSGGTEPTPGDRDVAVAEDPLPVDVWSHVALTYDGAQVRLYVDGELEDCSPVPAGAPPITSGDLEIGGATESGDYFKGRIDEVRIYNRALSVNEVAQTTSPSFREGFYALPYPESPEQGSTTVLFPSATVASGMPWYFYRYAINGDPFTAWKMTSLDQIVVPVSSPGTSLNLELYATDAAGNMSALQTEAIEIPGVVQGSELSSEDIEEAEELDADDTNEASSRRRFRAISTKGLAPQSIRENASPIECVLHSDDPHVSTHRAQKKEAAINAVTWIECGLPGVTGWVETQLWEVPAHFKGIGPPAPQKVKGQRYSLFGSTSRQHAVLDPAPDCKPGRYFTKGVAEEIPPAGWEDFPVKLGLNKTQSDTVEITKKKCEDAEK
jgi:hypothetical protein